MSLEQIHQLASLAQDRYQEGQLLVIAIDGSGGAGKTTLCQALAVEIEQWAPLQVLKLDDFYHSLDAVQRAQLQHGQARRAYFDERDFKQKIMQPLSQGLSASYQVIYWLKGASDQTVKILPRGVLLVDGVFSFSKPLRELVQLSVFVDTPLELRHQRLIARPQLTIDWVHHWQVTEAWHHEHEQTAKASEFVLIGR